MLKLAVVVVVVGLSGLAYGKGCCTPKAWQGTEATTFVYASRAHCRSSSQPLDNFVNHFDVEVDCGHAGFVESYKNISYDYENKRAAATTYVTGSGFKPRFYHTLIKDGMRYAVVKAYKTDKCYKKKLTEPFREMCIPDEAKELPSFYFGVGDGALKAKSYGMEIEDKHYKLGVYVSVTEDLCVPISESYLGVARKIPVYDNAGFINITPGIADPDVFEIPEECEDAEEGDPPEEELLERSYGKFVTI